MILNQLRHLRLVMALLILWACSLVQRHRPTLRFCMLSVPTVSLLPLPSKCSSRTSRVVLISLLTTTSTTTKWKWARRILPREEPIQRFHVHSTSGRKLSSRTGAFMWSTMVVSPRIIPSTMHDSSVWNTSCTTRITRTL